MPRPPRPIDEGLVYHAIDRGNNRQRVFSDVGDFEAFLKAMADLKERKRFELYGYCLMDNHIHLLLRPVESSISRIMQSLLVSHTQRYHRFHQSGGHVWEGRFKSPVVQDDDHLLAVLRYIEANPVRAGLVKRRGQYRWSSFAAHGQGRDDALLDPVVPYEGLGNGPAHLAGDGGQPMSTRSRMRPNWLRFGVVLRRGCRTALGLGSAARRAPARGFGYPPARPPPQAPDLAEGRIIVLTPFSGDLTMHRIWTILLLAILVPGLRGPPRGRWTRTDGR